MIATIDIGATRVRDLRLPATQLPGLRWTQLVVLPALASSRPPSLRRAGLLAFWDDDAASRRVSDLHPVARDDDDASIHLRLRPVRAFGQWLGLDTDLPRARRPESDEEVVVLTLGQLRISQLGRFLRASRPAERTALAAPGFRWGTAAARPPFVATITSWASATAAIDYAYATASPHDRALDAQRKKDFHVRSAFIRFAILDQHGPGPVSEPSADGDAPGLR
jgi:hypothetical protein